MSKNLVNTYLQMDKRGRWIVSFGQYSGSFLDDVIEEDRQYIEWFSNQDIPEPVREIIEAALD